MTDQTIVDRIAHAIKDLYTENNCTTLVEIGPGKGALTERIQSYSSQTLLIEYDQKMVDYLTKHKLLKDTTKLIHEDVLKRNPQSPDHFPYQSQSQDTLITGNLPYYITSPILRKFFEIQTPTRAGGVFLIQKEAADKILHNAPKKSFLRWLLNYAYIVERCFDVPAQAFTPPPKVISTVIRLRPKELDDIPHLNYQQLLTFLDLYSPYKRKTLGASQKIITKQQSKKGDQTPIMFDISKYSALRLEEL